jgi:hypothetical protein
VKRRKFCAVLLLVVLCVSTAYAQSSSAVGMPAKTAEPQKPVFPQWARDLRRAEIIAFGAFPFMMFFSAIAVDTYRASTHDWDSRYYPWPAKGPGAIEMNRDEHVLTLEIAVAGSLVIALADHLILQIKRARAQKQRLDLPEGDLIILRKPWPSEEAASDEAVQDEAASGETVLPGTAAGSEAGSAP